MRGTIVKALAGFYYVEPNSTEAAASHGLFQCRARGLFKKKGSSPLVGDEVEVRLTLDEEVEGYVTEIFPRRNEFVRPPIANIDLYLATVSIKDPMPNFETLDRALATAESQDVDAAICIGKADLGSPQYILDVYGGIYPVAVVSALSGDGIAELKDMLKGKRAAFAGPSGVGKSTLINKLIGSDQAETGVISGKTGRGKHTTRCVEIINTDFEAGLFDTPGFTAFEGVRDDEADIASYFPEFAGHSGNCRFDNCRHVDEPDCAVISAVNDGEIARSRYDSYVKMLKEARSRKAWEY